jgi:hypothetical protein
LRLSFVAGFLTAMRQEVTRAHKGWSLDSVMLHNDVTKFLREDIIAAPSVSRLCHVVSAVDAFAIGDNFNGSSQLIFQQMIFHSIAYVTVIFSRINFLPRAFRFRNSLSVRKNCG